MDILRLGLLCLALSAPPFAERVLVTGASQQNPLPKRIPLSVPGKVQSLVMSLQEGNRCLVQVDLAGAPQGQPLPAQARTQVWLLKQDGTSFAPTPQSRGETIVLSNAGWNSPIRTYEFPGGGWTESVAIVLQVDDQFFVVRSGG